ncbi:MAG: cyclodeaminase/cyclohydrolase family protein [Tissierellia bacterium]|nr:cyclodeaminase/cyclohydrolase family protein [Tissierellia bacterium]
MDYKDILDLVLDSDDVTVGGGSSSALSGAMAAGLMAMVTKLSMKKEFGLSKDELQLIAIELEKLKEELLLGAVKDREAYLEIVKAYKLPKVKSEENKRQKAIENAGVIAATAPKENAIKCKKLLEIGERLKGHTNPACATDLNMGIELAKAGLIGAKMNIEVNLSLIKDEEKLREFKEVLEEL